MSAKLSGSVTTSAAVFCPQSKASEEDYLSELHFFLCNRPRFEHFLRELLALGDTWAILAEEREDIANLDQGHTYMRYISEWITTGASSPMANCRSGIISLPMLVVMQICQYFQYLERFEITHSQLMVQLQAGAGVQGYCGGLLAAVAIAASKDEVEVLKNAEIAVRLALAIGAYGELGDDGSIPGATTIVVRLKEAGQGDELIEKFPGSYISAITDPKTISIVGPVVVLLKVQAYARAQGMLTQEMHIRGKVHNPENSRLSKELCQLCARNETLRLPHATNLQTPIRSNRTGELITQGWLTDEIVEVILASRCEWYVLLTKMAKDLDLSGRRNHTFVSFGIGDCIPLLPFNDVKVQIMKLDGQFLNTGASFPQKTDKLNDSYSYPQDAVAIIGASCRVPGANNLDELWDLISRGTSKHIEVPTSRFDISGSFRASQDRNFIDNRKFYGNFIDGVGNFDHAFFRISPKEALNMDPQQRILLELAYQAMDSSGYLASHQRQSGDPVGCFIGASFAEYLDNTNAYHSTAYTSTGTIRAFLCGRISYYFGWSGPAEVLDTACSSSLVAINRACKAIQRGECAMALAGGINVITGINNFLDLAKAGFLSPTGQCKPFDQNADGYCRSEGGGLVVLKLLSQALADNNQILGVIPGIGTNQGGLSPSITVPHVIAQNNLFQTVLHQANLRPNQVSYVEAHGTGTQAGDPLEIASIRQVFGGQKRINQISIGSLKGNIGHMETAAGVASLLKILAMLKSAKIPPQANHQSLNRKIPLLENDSMNISTRLMPWEGQLLAALVTSYGAAGSNCAMLCCESRMGNAGFNQAEATESDQTYPIIITATTEDGLRANAAILGKYLQNTTPKPKVSDVSFTLSRRRKLHSRAFVTSSSDISALAQGLGTDPQKSFEAPQIPKSVVLVFGGQFKRTVNMEQSLYLSYPRFKTYIDECNAIVLGLGFPALLPSIFQPEPLADITVLQCGTFAMQYACAKCWIDSGLSIKAVVGHSFGELTAMVISGVLSLRDGIYLIASRALLMTTKWGPEPGTMLAIHGSRQIVQDVVATINTGNAEPKIEIACYNAPLSQVVVGSSFAIKETINLLDRNSRFSGIRSEQLDLTHGFHSKFTDKILDDFERVSASLDYSKAVIPIETCTQIPVEQISAARVCQHAREPVFFSEAVQRIENRLGRCIWLEAGMNSPIISMIKRTIATPDIHLFQAMKMERSISTTRSMSNLTTNFWQEGIPVLYWSFLPTENEAVKQIWLPPYQFHKTTHWVKNIDKVLEAQNMLTNENKTYREDIEEFKCSLKLVRVVLDASKAGDTTEFDICLETSRFTKIVSGHAVLQNPLCPVSMYIECVAMGLQLHNKHIDLKALRFLDLSFKTALGVDLARRTFLILKGSEDSQKWSFELKSSQKEDPTTKALTHAKGKVALVQPIDFRTYERLVADRVADLEDASDAERLMCNRIYGLFSRVVHYAEFFQGISHVIMSKAEAKAKIDLPKESRFGQKESTVTQYWDAVAIDCFIQVVGLLINSSNLVTNRDVFVATGVDQVSTSSACNFHSHWSWTVYAKYVSANNDQVVGDIFVMTGEGHLAMIITGVHFTKLYISKLAGILDSANAKPIFQAAVNEFSVATKSSGTISTTTTLNGLKNQPDDEVGSNTVSMESDEEAALLNVNFSSLTTDLNRQHLQSCQLALNIITDISGAPIASMEPRVTLRELGIDSLSIIELRDDLQGKFQTEIDDDTFTLASTIEAVMNSLGLGDSFLDIIYSSTAATTKLKKQIGHLESETHQGTGVSREGIKLANPMNALLQCEMSFDHIAAENGYTNYWEEVHPKQDQLLVSYIMEAFQALGFDISMFPYDQLIPSIPHHPKHKKVMSRLFLILEEGGLLVRKGSGFVRGGGELPTMSSGALHKQFLTEYPHYASEVQLMALTGPKLADCLAGTVEAISLLFHDFVSQKVMEDYYCNSPMLFTLTEQLVIFLKSVMASSDRTSCDNPIRILEVGAGFGGTTMRVAELLQSSGTHVSYTFSDISPSLIKSAKAKFAKHPWMDFQTLNLENEMPSSLRGMYDIVIGTNCVHATTDRTQTICRLKSALSCHGFIVLSEVTQPVSWYDMVFGLLDGWWLAKDGSNYPLQPPEAWVQSFKNAGLTNISYSQGSNRESRTQRLFVAFNNDKPITMPDDRKEKFSLQTTTYKKVDSIEVEADIYLPTQPIMRAMPVALMIHGGGHMTLSKKAIRPFQIDFLLAHKVLPVSIDYRLCPEINLIDGPITDVCDAYAWVQKDLQAIVKEKGISVDEKIVVIGWSTGGHLAMTTAWTSKQAGLKPPVAILSFYGPTDFESGDLDMRRDGIAVERRLSINTIISSLSPHPVRILPPPNLLTFLALPILRSQASYFERFSYRRSDYSFVALQITSYHPASTNASSNQLDWLRPDDPRSELVLSLFEEGYGLPLLLNGLRPSDSGVCLAPPLPQLIASISPLSHLRLGTYSTPTFIIHGTEDEIVPYHTAVTFIKTMQDMGLRGELGEVKGARHIHDMELREGAHGWWEGVAIGYQFLFRELGLEIESIN